MELPPIFVKYWEEVLCKDLLIQHMQNVESENPVKKDEFFPT
jgi:hypothetical protein